MTGIDYHERHEAYMSAVAAALAAAVFPNDGGNAEPNDPRDGFVGLDLERLGTIDGKPIWTATEVAVCWQEERGWFLLTIADPASNDGRFVYELGIATIAAPSTVAVAVAEQAGLNIEVAADGHPDVDFPGHEFDDEDPEFEAALLHYAEAS
jgi:hypothetical protein